MGENMKHRTPECGGVMYLGVPHYCDHPYLPASLRRETCACRPLSTAPAPDELEVEEPALSCPHLDAFIAATNPPPEALEEIEAARSINSQLRYGLWHEKARADQAQSALAAMRADNQDLLAAADADAFVIGNLQAEVKRLTEEKEALRAALGDMRCPRPCNHRPDEFDAKDCVAAGECGCGAHILAQASSGSKE